MKLWTATVHVLDGKKWTSYEVPRIEAASAHTALNAAVRLVTCGRRRRVPKGIRIQEIKVSLRFIQVLKKVELVLTQEVPAP